MRPSTRSFGFVLSLLAAAAVFTGCGASTTDEDLGDESSDAISTTSSLLGSYGRVGTTDPILGLTVAGSFGTKEVHFVLYLDPQVVVGACAAGAVMPCDGAFVEGTVKSTRGSAAKGSFTLAPRDPSTLSPAAAAFVGKYTFTRGAAGLALHNVASASTQTVRVIESPVNGPPTAIAGTWTPDDSVPAGANVYASLVLTPGAGLKGTFTAQKSLAPGAPAVSGTYGVGAPNAMIGLAPFILHESGGQDLQLMVGSAMRDANGKIQDLGVVVANQPSKGFHLVRQ